MSRRRAVVLLAEDSLADQVIVRRALEDGRVDCDLLVVNDGEEALKLLRHETPFEDINRYPMPDLLLLDINMPVLDGLQTLQAIRADKSLDYLAIIILTTSARDKDVMDSYRLGVNAYMTKPVSEQAFVNAVIQLERFWFELVTLPNRIDD